MKVIDRCPSGALTYKEKTARSSEKDASSSLFASIRVVKNGPLLVEGDCRLLNSAGDEMAKRGTYALCRCGASRKNPFCDGSHIKMGFDDTE